MKCHNCGAPVFTNSKACQYCGAHREPSATEKDVASMTSEEFRDFALRIHGINDYSVRGSGRDVVRIATDEETR
jgi:hypothetical protein